MNKILASLLTIGVITTCAFGLSRAFFSDTETASQNLIKAGGFDLLINNQNNPSNIINFTDLKPMDSHIVNSTLLVNRSPAKIWLHIKNLLSDQGSDTEEELTEENGIPKHDIENYITYSLQVGESQIIANEDAILLSDIVSCWIPLGQIPSATEQISIQNFYFSPTVTNWAQGDRLTFAQEFLAQQIEDTSTPDTGSGRIWSSPLKKCIQEDITTNHNLIFTCISGCGGIYQHTINMSPIDTNTGDFSGTGFYNPNSNIAWTIAGNTSGASFNAHIIYTNINPGYFINLTGKLNSDGDASGTATSSAAQTFTWILSQS